MYIRLIVRWNTLYKATVDYLCNVARDTLYNVTYTLCVMQYGYTAYCKMEYTV